MLVTSYKPRAKLAPNLETRCVKWETNLKKKAARWRLFQGEYLHQKSSCRSFGFQDFLDYLIKRGVPSLVQRRSLGIPLHSRLQVGKDRQMEVGMFKFHLELLCFIGLRDRTVQIGRLLEISLFCVRPCQPEQAF